MRGLGTFTDDIALPGMLHGAILRSPLAHARILAVDTAAAEAHPKVRAVITGAMLAERKLAWMPTLSRDVQAVLATDKVRFQGQEVAFVVAEDGYSARDALELIDVAYEPLPVVVDATRALDPGAPVIRDDLAGQPDNHIFDWSAGDQAATDAVFAAADVVVAPGHALPALTPGPAGDLRRGGRHGPGVSGKLTVWCTSQAPHAHRTLYALLAGLPEHKIRIISPDIGGGFGNKVPIYPGYLCAVVGSMLTGRPVKWVEDRSENLMSTAFARDYHMHGEIAATRDGRILGLRARVLADHGAFNGVGAADQVPGRVLPHLHRLLRPAGRALHGHRRVHEQGARWGGLLLLVPHRRGGVPGRADGRPAGRRAGHGPGRAADEEPAPARAVPVHRPDRLGVRLRRLPAGAAAGAGHGGLPGAAPRAGREAGPRRAHGHRA